MVVILLFHTLGTIGSKSLNAFTVLHLENESTGFGIHICLNPKSLPFIIMAFRGWKHPSHQEIGRDFKKPMAHEVDFKEPLEF